MAFAITKSCCADASCVSVCPVGCIHPSPGEPGFGTSEILHIDPRACIDCGACADACPVQAIFPVDGLSAADRAYAEINAEYFLAECRTSPRPSPTHYPKLPPAPCRDRVAVVGSGPAGMYTVKELLTRTEAEITVLDALPTPGGLVRSGVAADHQETKGIQRIFDIALRHPRVRFLGGVRVGHDITLAELQDYFDAVFLATGARIPRRLGVPGEELPGVLSALDVVRWAGGEPGAGCPMPATVSTKTERAVIVGTGNVALDLVRMFTLPAHALAHTDISDHALAFLHGRPILDVVVLGRGPSSRAAYTEAEYRALSAIPDLEVRVIEADASAEAFPWDLPDHPRVTFVFGSVVERFEASTEAPVRVVVARDQAGESTGWTARAAITSIGHVSEPLEGITYSDGVPIHVCGRLADASGIYLVGWAKRGAIGGIGANRQCATETVDTYLEDLEDFEDLEERPRAHRSADDLERSLRNAGVRIVTRRGSTRIDRQELRAGAVAGRPRVKLTDLEELHRVARRRIGAR